MRVNLFGELMDDEPEDRNLKKEKPNNRPVKVRSSRRGNKWITLILNMPFHEEELKQWAKKIKARLGCGGSVKIDTIEIQGEQVEKVREFLIKQGIKAQ